MALCLNDLESTSPKNILCLFSSGSGEDFLKVVYIFLHVLYPNNLPLGKGVTLYLNKIEYMTPKKVLCQVLFKYRLSMVLEKKMKILTHDHKLRNYLSLIKYILNISPSFTCQTVLIFCRYEQYMHSNTISKFWLVIKSSSNVTSV